MSSYAVNGIDLPSVTTVIGLLDKSSALIPWGVKMALQHIRQNASKDATGAYVVGEAGLEAARNNWRDVKEEAADIGSEVHDLIRNYIQNGQDAIGEINDKVQNAFLAFLEWEKANVEKWIESEQTVAELTTCYAGTLDAIVKMKDGRVLLIDFKSSKGFYDGFDMQVAAYRYARERMDGNFKFESKAIKETKKYSPIKIDSMGILRLDKETGFPEWKEYPDYERKIQAFHCLLGFYYADKKRRLKNNPRVR